MTPPCEQHDVVVRTAFLRATDIDRPFLPDQRLFDIFVTAAVNGRVRLHLTDVYAREWLATQPTNWSELLLMTIQQLDQVPAVDNISCRVTPLG